MTDTHRTTSTRMSPAGGAQVADVQPPAWLERHRVTDLRATMDEVRGLDAAKREIASLVARLRHPEVMRAAGGEIPRGILLHGPAGCGKTLLARSMAALLTSGDRPAEMYSVAASDMSAVRFEELAAYLRTRDAASPIACVYIDEIDLWGRSRGDSRHSTTTAATLQGALAAIDGLSPASASAVFIGSTNERPRSLDAALVRPGRLGFWIEVRPPTRREAEDILRYYARTRPIADGVDWKRAAALARPNISPAGLRQALDDALALAIADGGPTAIVEWRHVSEALLRDGRIEPEEVWTERRVRATAVHEAGHTAARLKYGLPVRSVSLRKDGGLTDGRPDHHDEAVDADDVAGLRDRVAELLAGMAAEELLTGTVTTGGGADVASATAAAKAIVMTGTGGLPPVRLGMLFDDPPSAAKDATYAAVATIIIEGQHRAYALCAEHLAAIDRFAVILAEQRHLSGAELAAALRDSGFDAGARADESEPSDA